LAFGVNLPLTAPADKSAIHNPQSTIRNPNPPSQGFGGHSPQSALAILNPQSAIRNKKTLAQLPGSLFAS
jgi:hypothetical protein